MVRQILGASNQMCQFFPEGICRILLTIFLSTSDPTRFFCWITTYPLDQTLAHLLLPLQESYPNLPQFPKKSMRFKPSLARWEAPSACLQLFLPVLLSVSIVVVVAPRARIGETESISLMRSPSIPTHPMTHRRCKAQRHSSHGTSQGPSHLLRHHILVPLVWMAPRRRLIIYHRITRPQQQRSTLLTMQNL